METGVEYAVVWGFDRTHRTAIGFYEGMLTYKGNHYYRFDVTGGAMLLVDIDFFISSEPYVRRIVV